MLKKCICKQCGVEFTGGMRAYYCPTCRAERTRQRDRKRKKIGAIRKIGSTDMCQRCGKQYTVNAGMQKFCPECGVINDKQIKAESFKRRYADPEKRKEMLSKSRQWAIDNRERMIDIARKNYEKYKDKYKINRGKRYLKEKNRGCEITRSIKRNEDRRLE